MIEELKPLPIIDEYGNEYGLSAPTMWEMMDKINEIIRYLNKKEEQK